MNWAYLAGFTDGDGHIAITPRKGKYGYTFVRIRWSQKESESKVLYHINHFLQGQGINTTSCRLVSGHHYPQREFGVGGMEDVKKCLDAMLPYLINKREKAMQALKLLNSWLDLKREHGYHWRDKLVS